MSELMKNKLRALWLTIDDKLRELWKSVNDPRYWITAVAVVVLAFADRALAGTFLWSLLALWVAVGAAHILRRQFLPYIDVLDLYEKAKSDPVGAGLALLAFGFVFGSVALASMLVLIKVT